MTPSNKPTPHPRWPAIVAAAAFSLLHFAMPNQLTLIPGWIVASVTGVLLLLAMITHKKGNEELNQFFAFAMLGAIAMVMVSSLAVLIMRLPLHKDPPVDLLRAAAALWISNILVFASWYWRMDGGGPNVRDKLEFHVDGAFLFPQMMMDPKLRKQMGEDRWSPGFVDYLFLAFNTSTAFSPTDVPVLTRWAKVLMMVQSMISLTTLALLAARAVNIL
ncbi:MAG: hypothetical protein QOJ99_485 [Bryobacterales bacterium]|nr:hypothetical protein [Bryobacterales bacterium]